MVTRIPQVNVNRIEGGGGFTATCTCRWRIIRPHREGADQAAVAHRASHQRPDPADTIPDLDLREWVS